MDCVWGRRGTVTWTVHPTGHWSETGPMRMSQPVPVQLHHEHHGQAHRAPQPRDRHDQKFFALYAVAVGIQVGSDQHQKTESEQMH